MDENLLLSLTPSLALLLGWALDLLLGDPESWPHPVVYMGRWIHFLELRLNKGSGRMIKGALTAILSILLTYLLTEGLALGLEHLCSLHPALWILSLLFQTLVVFFCLAGKTLRKEVRMVFEALEESLEKGRRQVGRIVGRDTENLSAQQVRTAALETEAENLSDGVIAPLFWFLLLGPAGMMAYKMVNTLDSMIGYQNPRFKDFGCWAAHIDDIANFIPARLTALLMALSAWWRGDLRKGLIEELSFILAYGSRHASPNSGYPEAALAGILDCQFGGSHDYFGELFYKPHIGTNPRPLDTQDMRITLKVCLLSEAMAVAAVLFLLSL